LCEDAHPLVQALAKPPHPRPLPPAPWRRKDGQVSPDLTTIGREQLGEVGGGPGDAARGRASSSSTPAGRQARR
jgi:hypothetical protein